MSFLVRKESRFPHEAELPTRTLRQSSPDGRYHVVTLPGDPEYDAAQETAEEFFDGVKWQAVSAGEWAVTSPDTHIPSR